MIEKSARCMGEMVEVQGRILRIAASLPRFSLLTFVTRQHAIIDPLIGKKSRLVPYILDILLEGIATTTELLGKALSQCELRKRIYAAFSATWGDGTVVAYTECVKRCDPAEELCVRDAPMFDISTDEGMDATIRSIAHGLNCLAYDIVANISNLVLLFKLVRLWCESLADPILSADVVARILNSTSYEETPTLTLYAPAARWGSTCWGAQFGHVEPG